MEAIEKSFSKIPVQASRSYTTKNFNETFGEIFLRKNIHTHLIENSKFNSKLLSYDEGYQANQANSERFIKHMSEIVEMLKSKYPKGAKLVEVGCGKGDFVEFIQNDGYFKITGYDAAYQGKNPAIQNTFLDSNSKITADLVILRHVLEHIHKPHHFLRMLADIFSTSDIYIEVPETDWIFENEVFFDITYEHVNYFNKDSISNLFKNIIDTGVLFERQYLYLLADIQSLNYHDLCKNYDDQSSCSQLN